MRRLLNFAAFLALTFVAGCGSLSPQPDRSRFFTLTSKIEGDTTDKNTGLEQISLGIGPLRIPGYLDREEIITRTGQNRFEVAQNDHWIEPLEENLSRVLAQNLYALLRFEHIVRYPWANNRRITHQVEIEILRFEPTSEREAHLEARWSVIDFDARQPLAVKRSLIKRPIKDSTREASVEAMSEALADFSREIANAVRAVAAQNK
jgi:uncharacterized lipoprotein YmbA